MLAKAGSQSIRPDEIEGEDPARPFGLHGAVYRLSPAQVSAILELRLNRLTGLEQDKLHAEYAEILAQIAELQSILDSFDKLMEVIRTELNAVLVQYGDARRTSIVESRIDFSRADLIPEEQVVLTVSKTGYAKTQPLEDYAAQRRGGRGKSATSMREDDYIEHLVVASNHATVLCFTNRGKVYWLKVYDVPQASRGAKGRPLVNLLPLGQDESVSAILPLSEYLDDHYVFMATASGTVKRVVLEQFSRPRSVGLIAIDLKGEDTLIGVAITDGTQQIMLFSNEGKAIRFAEDKIRPMGRTAKGVRGMRVSLVADLDGEDDVVIEEMEDDSVEAGDTDFVSRVVSLLVVPESGEVLTACANGYGKRTPVQDFPTKGRGGKGLIAIKTSARNGELVSATVVSDADELLLISDAGTMVRTRVAEVSVTGRNAQGVMLIRLAADETLVGVVRVDAVEVDVLDVADEAGTADLENDPILLVDAELETDTVVDVVTE